MRFANRSQVLFLEIPGQSNKDRPQTTMYISNFYPDEPTNKHTIIVPDKTRSSKDFLGHGVNPPASPDRSPQSSFGQVWPFELSRTRAVFLDETNRIKAHEKSPSEQSVMR